MHAILVRLECPSKMRCFAYSFGVALKGIGKTVLFSRRCVRLRLEEKSIRFVPVCSSVLVGKVDLEQDRAPRKVLADHAACARTNG